MEECGEEDAVWGGGWQHPTHPFSNAWFGGMEKGARGGEEAALGEELEGLLPHVPEHRADPCGRRASTSAGV